MVSHPPFLLSACTLALALAWSAFAEQAAIERVPAPDPKAVADAQKSVREIFKKEFAATQPKEKQALVETLIAQAEAPANDPPSRFAMLREALVLATQASNSRMVFQLLDTLNARFEIPAPAMKDLLATAGAIRDPEAAKALAAMKALADKPDDAASSVALAKYRCLAMYDWKGALPVLATHGGPAWKELAELDAADPKGAEDRVALGNKWWDAGAKETVADFKQGAQERAAFWYLMALPELGGLGLLQIQKRLDEVNARPNRRIGKPGLFVTYYTGQFETQRATGVLENVNHSWGHGSPLPSIPSDNFSVRWIGVLQVPTAGEYTFFINVADKGSIWVNGKEVVASTGYDKKGKEGKVVLKAGLVPFCVRFYEDRGNSWLNLKWKPPGAPELVTIPNENFWHDPARAAQYVDQKVNQ